MPSETLWVQEHRGHARVNSPSRRPRTSTPTPVTALGARGVGEAGTVAAGAAVWTAVNDAL
jgi:hypothetical protein